MYLLETVNVEDNSPCLSTTFESVGKQRFVARTFLSWDISPNLRVTKSNALRIVCHNNKPVLTLWFACLIQNLSRSESCQECFHSFQSNLYGVLVSLTEVASLISGNILGNDEPRTICDLSYLLHRLASQVLQEEPSGSTLNKTYFTNHRPLLVEVQFTLWSFLFLGITNVMKWSNIFLRLIKLIWPYVSALWRHIFRFVNFERIDLENMFFVLHDVPA